MGHKFISFSPDADIICDFNYKYTVGQIANKWIDFCNRILSFNDSIMFKLPVG